VVERVRITNPYKINAVVNFEIVDPNAKAPVAAPEAAAPAKGGKDKAPPAKKGGKEAAAAPTAPVKVVDPTFSVSPATWDIPPHESRFVTVSFNPKDMAAYRGMLRATVVDAVDPLTKEISFNLAGAGTLPCVTIVSPAGRTPQGTLLLDYGQVQVSIRDRATKCSAAILFLN
jgi:hypothetical protein